MTAARPPCRLYLITPPRFDIPSFAEVLSEALAAGDVACVQLRLKGAPDDEIREAARRLMPLVHAHDTAFVINDRPDLAAELGADGVHIGQDDGTVAAARAVLGAEAIVGVTCHASKHLAMVAGEEGADYVAFGAFFPTPTKTAKSRATPDLLRWWQDVFEIPSVAIGGITVENCAPLIAAGADFLAVSAGVWSHPEGAGAAVRRFNRLMAPPPEPDQEKPQEKPQDSS